MADNKDLRLLTAWDNHRSPYYDMGDWTDGEDSDSNQRRSDIIFSFIEHGHTDLLMKVLGSGWDVNEKLYWTHSDTGLLTCWTAVQVASWRGSLEAVKLLFDAGASYMTPGIAGTPLMLALHNRKNCSADLIDLLLKHGAAANLTETLLCSVPLVKAILGIEYDEEFTKIVQLLLENGADPNITATCTTDAHECALLEGLDLLPRIIYTKLYTDAYQNIIMADMVNETIKSNAALLETLVKFGADASWNVAGNKPLLHRMVRFIVQRGISAQPISDKFPDGVTSLYLQEHLDVFYQNGGNINMACAEHGTALEDAVREGGNSNNVRWLIRHGAHIPPSIFTLLERYFIPNLTAFHLDRFPMEQYEETPLILLHAGMRVPNQAYMYLTSIYKEVSAWQEHIHSWGGVDHSHTSQTQVNDIWSEVVKEEDEYLAKVNNKFNKFTFPEHLRTQVADLEEFSDESLLVYPEIIPEKWQTKDKLSFALDQIRKVLEFLSQPRSLQLHCSRCVQENLVSLQPSVVKTLPVPARLKRLILCHEL